MSELEPLENESPTPHVNALEMSPSAEEQQKMVADNTKKQTEQAGETAEKEIISNQARIPVYLRFCFNSINKNPKN